MTLYQIADKNGVITDGTDLKAVINESIAFLEGKMIEDGHYGEDEVDVTVIQPDEDIEFPLTLKLCTEADAYDGGRFDYLSGIGAI